MWVSEWETWCFWLFHLYWKFNTVQIIRQEGQMSPYVSCGWRLPCASIVATQQTFICSSFSLLSCERTEAITVMPSSPHLLSHSCLQQQQQQLTDWVGELVVRTATVSVLTILTKRLPQQKTLRQTDICEHIATPSSTVPTHSLPFLLVLPGQIHYNVTSVTIAYHNNNNNHPSLNRCMFS